MVSFEKVSMVCVSRYFSKVIKGAKHFDGMIVDQASLDGQVMLDRSSLQMCNISSGLWQFMIQFVDDFPSNSFKNIQVNYYL